MSIFLKKYTHYGIAYVLGVSILCALCYSTLFAPAFNFPEKKLISIEAGSTTQSVASMLEEQNVIQSSFIFSKVVILLGGEGLLQAGTYYFDTPQNVLIVAKRLLSGDLGQERIRITVPEGLTREDMGDIFEDALPLFDKEEFLMRTKEKEGYLFPDTYYFLPSSTTSEVVFVLEHTFWEKMELIQEEILSSDKTLSDIITMASIIEAEASAEQDRRLVSGILWKRLDIGMPLQVDVTFRYINGKTSADLSLDDLEEESPYNTYVNKGLPPTPISSPSLESIVAAIHPVESAYLYFLADSDNVVHYSEDFEEHKRKKALYIW